MSEQEESNTDEMMLQEKLEELLIPKRKTRKFVGCHIDFQDYITLQKISIKTDHTISKIMRMAVKEYIEEHVNEKG